MTDRVQAVDRALSLLDELAASPDPLSTPELARRAGVNRATAWRLLNSLEASDLVERETDSGRFRVGFGAVRIARGAPAETMARRSRPVLEALAEQTQGSVFLEVASAGTLIVVAEAKPPGPLLVDLANIDVPLHCGSVGKLYLACLPAIELDEYLLAPREQCTDHTITEPLALRQELEGIRKSGFATNYQEHHHDWCGICVPIRDLAGRELAFLNVTLPTMRTSAADLVALAPRLFEAAREIEKRLSPP